MPYPFKSLATVNAIPRPVLHDMTVVIPTLGRSILEACLYWIVVGDAWPRELIVVDQGRSQDVVDWIARLQSFGLQAEYLPSHQRGRAAGVNRGLERVKTHFVAVTDDDCFVETDWLNSLVGHLRTAPEAIVTGRVEAAGDEDVLGVVTSLEPAVYHRPRLTFDPLSGGNMGTSMSVIKHVGLLDEDVCLRTAEDGEWAYRALRAGVPIIYAPEVIVQHYGWRDESQRTMQYQDYARSQGGFYGKYLRQGDWFIALRIMVHHLRAFRRWLRGFLTGNQECARYGRAYLTGLLPGIMAGIRRSKVS